MNFSLLISILKFKMDIDFRITNLDNRRNSDGYCTSFLLGNSKKSRKKVGNKWPIRTSFQQSRDQLLNHFRNRQCSASILGPKCVYTHSSERTDFSNEKNLIFLSKMIILPCFRGGSGEAFVAFIFFAFSLKCLTQS